MIRYLLLLLSIVILNTYAQEILHNHSSPHSFIENKGQWDESILFQSNFSGGNMWIQQHKFVFHLQDFSATHEAHLGKEPNPNVTNKEHVVHFNFLNSNKISSIEKKGGTDFYYNYFLGNDPDKWKSDVRGYSEALLKELYNGIDLKLIEQELNLKYEFHVKPNINPNQIKIDIAGFETIKIDEKGSLQITTPAGNIMEEKPYAYQIKNGKIVEVSCAFSLNNSELTFNLGNYDSTVELIIDPTLIFATYSGSLSDNFGMTATYAYDGSVYSGGTVYGNRYPTPDNNAFDISSNFTVLSGNYGITDVFISKYSTDGSLMLWTSFIGGGNNIIGTETVHSMISDQNDNVYFFGATSSTDFPIQGGYQTTHAGGRDSLDLYYNGVHYKMNGTDLYVAKLSSNGHNLMGSTYFGGSANDGVSYRDNLPYAGGGSPSGTYYSITHYDSLTINYGDQFRGEIMLDESGNCLVASCTKSTNFPVLNAVQPTLGGMQDGVVFKLTPNLSNLVWSTYYGGSNHDACYSVKVDSSYNVVVGGGTSSNDLIGTSGGWQSSYNGGKTDGFVFKLTPNGQTITQSTYVGTANMDQVFFVEIDRNDNVFLLGQSSGGLFPVLNSAYSIAGSSQFIAKLNNTLTTLENSTVFGNGSPNINISPSAFMVDICGNMYVCGWGGGLFATSPPLSGMPVSSGALIMTPPNGFDFYLFVLRRDFSNMLYGSYLGGNRAREHVDGGTSRFDKNGIVYQSACGGCGGFSDFDFTSYSQNQSVHSRVNRSSNCNNLVFKFDFNLLPNAEFSPDNVIGCAPLTVQLNNTSSPSDSYKWDFGNGTTTTTVVSPSVVYSNPGTYVVKLFVTDSICLITDSFEVTITVTPPVQLSVSQDEYLCLSEPVSFTANSNGTATGFVWSDSPTFSNILGNDSILTVTPTDNNTYYVQASNPGCVKLDSVKVFFVDLELTGQDSVCVGDISTYSLINPNPGISFTYSWFPVENIVNGNGTNQIQVQLDESKYVRFVAISSNGCTIEDSIFVNVGGVPNLSINATATPNITPTGTGVQLNVNPPGYTYSWTPANLVLNSSNQTTPTVKLDESTLFTVFVSDEFCVRTDTVWVQVYPFVCDDPFVFVPNAFTPNGDGENDKLFVYGSMIQGLLFRIYDRWGELVFETTNRNEGWDGTFRGKILDPDVYDYYLQVDCIDGLQNIIKGNITLMR